jgi:fermentation-respiration switch protein FrsA (DUF1100 family)
VPPEVVYGLGVLAVLAGTVLIAAWLLAGQIVRRRRPDAAHLPGSLGLPFEHVTFTARDGIELGGRLVGEGIRPGARRPVVLFCAGLFGSMDGDTPLLPDFVRAGFDVLQFDWRAHGVSDGRCATLGVREVDDLLGAIDFLQARGVRRIGLLGFSMGGAVALRVAARDPRVSCVVCDGGFVNIAHALTGYLREKLGLPLRPFVRLVLALAGVRLGGLRLEETSPLSEVGRISPRPVLFVHGGADPFVPVEDQEAIYAACGQPKALWRVDRAGHREAHRLEPDTYRERVIGFFRANLR